MRVIFVKTKEQRKAKKMRKHVKGHLVAELARKAEKSDKYVRLLLDGERETNTEIAQKIVKAGTIMETALEKANKDVDKIFKK